jgi:molybdopterin-containing oxidoreductase family iron-sulfur binding subunit
VFGNVNDKESEIYNIRKKDQAERLYYVLEHIHVLPNINYLAKIRNTEEIHSHDEAKDELLKYHV